MDKVFFDGGDVLLRTLIVALLGYLSLLLFLRISGKRTLAKMNAFDFVVTVALGSTLASLLLSKEVSLAQGTLALALLILFQFLITWTTVRLPGIRRIITGEPALLLHKGQLLHQAMRKSRITEEEVRAAVRAAGQARLEALEAVVLETDGTFSVLAAGGEGESSSLEGVEIPR